VARTLLAEHVNRDIITKEAGGFSSCVECGAREMAPTRRHGCGPVAPATRAAPLAPSRAAVRSAGAVGAQPEPALAFLACFPDAIEIVLDLRSCRASVATM
jgi:hypothetical protein